MIAIDEAALKKHIGTRMVDEDTATEAPLRMIVATFDRPETAPREGEPIPPGWHIGYFLNMAPQATLLADGLPQGAGVLPPIPLPRRMFAGVKLTFHGDIRVGDNPYALSLEIRGLALTEVYDGAFREAVKAGEKSGIPKRDAVPANLPWQRTHKANVVSLFRFSAITWNPHRIHYDTPYATGTEGYPALVVHGPYSQHCLIDFIRDHTKGRRIGTFSMRARAPLFETEPFTLAGGPSADGKSCEAYAVTPAGSIAMQVTSTLG